MLCVSKDNIRLMVSRVMINCHCNDNNMQFNGNKFELRRYGKEREIKSATTYKSYDDSNIDCKEQVRDLFIMMSITATFTLHIRNIVEKARDKMGWVLRIIYIWKITQHIVENIDGTMGHKMETRKHPGHGTQCVIQYPTNRNIVKKFKKMQ